MKKSKLILTALCFGLVVTVARAETWVSTAVTNIGYSTRTSCHLDILYPKGLPNFATVIWFHGGGLTEGGPHWTSMNDRSIAEVRVQYRLHTKENGLQGRDIILDAAEATAWVLEHIAEYGGDPKQVYVSGLSAGGYLTMMVGMAEWPLKEFGHSNMELKGLIPVTGQATTHFGVRKFAGDTSPTYVPKIDELAPLSYVGNKMPPILSICGQPGYELPERAEENRLLINSVRAMGNPYAWYVELPYMTHGGTGETYGYFLRLYVKAKKHTPDDPFGLK